MTKKTENVDTLFTWVGTPASEIASKLAMVFPLEAFKPLGGSSKGLSDINTGFMIERLTEVFGPKGLGWNLIYDAANMLLYGDPQPSHQFNQLLAWLKDATFEYYLFTAEDKVNPAMVIKIQTSGTSVNDQPYAEEGARTNATGAAIKWLMFQNELYKGNLDAALNIPKDSKPTQTRKKREPAKESKKPVSSPKSNGQPPNEAKNAKPSAFVRACAYTIPEDLGLPYSGTLGDLLEKDAAGIGMLSYLAGLNKSPSGDLYKPADEEGKKVQAAAKFILDEIAEKETK